MITTTKKKAEIKNPNAKKNNVDITRTSGYSTHTQDDHDDDDIVSTD